MFWNYRVVETFNRDGFFIAEVYYEEGEELSWCATTDQASSCTNYEAMDSDGYGALKETLQLMLAAFDKPTLRVAEGDRLEEIPVG